MILFITKVVITFRYLKSQCDIDNLNIGSVLLGDLEKVGWVGLKCDYGITNGGEQQEYLYHMNNNIFPKKRNIGTKLMELTENFIRH